MILPAHPRPLPGEILSSWLVRLASANGYQNHTFYNKLLNYKAAIWNRDVDLHPSAGLFEVLSNYTGQPLSAILVLGLDNYQGVLFEKLESIGNTPWILPVGVFHRQRTRNGMQLCPQCLRDDINPYYRRKWRLSFYTVCDIHRCLLLDCCPCCHAHIAFHRHGMGLDQKVPKDGLNLCYRCRFDLREATGAYPSVPSVVLDTYLRFLAEFEDGTWASGNLAPRFSIPLFKGLKILIALIIGRHGRRLRKTIRHRIDLDLSFCDLPKGKRKYFEEMSVLQRYSVVAALFSMLDDWPKKFVAIARESGVTRSNLSTDNGVLPFWIALVAYEYLDFHYYKPCKDEVVGASNYLRMCNKRVKIKNLCEVLDISLTTGKAVWNMWKADCKSFK